jgi:eukaryotic-like serine/threonine-protein kinase
VSSSPDEFRQADPKSPTRRLLSQDMPVGAVGHGSVPLELQHGSGATQDSSATLEVSSKPSRIGRYEIVREVGRGGMGIVYEAYDPTLQRTVALKMILGTKQADLENWARFTVEARALGQLQHPNIVQLYEFGDEAGQLYFTLEFIEGGSLKARSQGISARDAVALVIPLAEAIHVAHQKGIIHRDLKPGNILMTSAGEPKIVDFGLAKLRQDPGGTLTHAGDVLGTPQYMAPEQANGLNNLIGPATDVYALGAILYELLTGQPPFAGDDTMQTVLAVMHQEPRPPRRLKPNLPRDLETICLKCLYKEPWHRYGSGAALEADLRRFLAGESIQARPLNPAERTWRWVRRHPAVAALLLLVVLVTALGFAGVLWQWQIAEERAQAEREARGESERQEQKANLARAAAERSLYFSRILQAQHAYEANNIPQALHLLDLCRPATGMPDYRAWEWHYLKRLCHAELRTLITGEHWVWGVAFSPDGRLLATAAGSPYGETSKNPGRLTLWDATTLQQVGTLDGHQGSVQNMTFSPDGQSLLSVSLDGTARLWDVASRRQSWQTTCRRSNYQAGPACFTPDGKEAIVAASDDSSSRINCATGKASSLEGRLVGIDAQGRIALYRPGQKECVFVAVADGQGQHTVAGVRAPQALSPDGQTLAVLMGGGGVHVQNVADGATRMVNLPPGHVYALAFSPDGTSLAIGGADRVVRIWDVIKGETVREYRGHIAPVRGIAFRADGTRLASSDQLGQVKVWDFTRDPCQQRLLHREIPPEGIGTLGFRKDGARLALLVDTHHLIHSWDVRSGCLIEEQPGPMTGSTMFPRCDRAFSRDGRLFCSPVRADSRKVKAWDTRTGKEALSLAGQSRPVRCVTFSADGSRIATAAFGVENRDGARVITAEPATIWDVATGSKVSVLKPGPALVVALSPDGRRAATISRADGANQLWLHDTQSGAELWHQPAESSVLTNLTFSPDGKWLASVGFDDGLVKLWNVADGTSAVFERAPLGQRSLTAVSFTPDGKRLAAVGYDGDVHMWDIASGTAVLTLRCPGGPRPDDFGFCPQLAFSSDGFLASNDWQAIVSIWDGRNETSASASEQTDHARPWHQQQAEVYQLAGRTFAAEFHRKQLAKTAKE